MIFKKLASHIVSDGATDREIAVYSGDLAAIPPEHHVDLLVLSAFPDDYIPTKRSLIGALHRAGLSVEALASDKEHDLRNACHFWLSKPISGVSRRLNIDRVACFESRGSGNAAEIVGNVFRGLFPFLDEDHESTVAMSLLASGDQRESWQNMLDAILSTAERWMSRGLAIKELKIVVLDAERAHHAAARLTEWRPSSSPGSRSSSQALQTGQHDIFLSFSSRDGKAASLAKAALQRRSDVRNVFDFRKEIPHGANWQAELDRAMAESRAVISLMSPDYEESPECQEEIMQARFRHKHEARPVLFPIYWRTLGNDLKLWIKTINYADCREQSTSKLVDCISAIRL